MTAHRAAPGAHSSEPSERPWSRQVRVLRGEEMWIALGICALMAGAWLRGAGLRSQILIDDEWHAVHKLMRADMLDIVTHLDYADYSIPLTVYFRWLHDTVGLTEWGMHLPMLVAGIAFSAIAPLLVRPWTTPAVRATWAVLLAISPLLVYFSRTARPYALTTLLCIVAFIAFPRWMERDRYRDRWSAVYVIATVMAAWLHMTTLAFTLIPFLYFGVRSLRAGAAATSPLFKLALATAIPLAVVLLPPLVNDWFMFTAKAGVDSVTLNSAWRTMLMLAGSGYAPLALVLGACAALGGMLLWRRDRVLAGYLFAFVGGGTMAIMAARPNWVMHPGVFARYLAPIVPLLLLLAAEGFISLMPAKRAPLQAAGVTVLAAALWAAGPLPAQSYMPNQFTGHARFQFDYDDTSNPYVQRIPPDHVPAFYRELAKAPAGSLTLIEAPWRLESHFNPHVWYQRVHRQNVMIGLVTPICGTWSFGEYPETYTGMKLAHMAHLSALLRGNTYGADYLVMHVRPWRMASDIKLDWPDVVACLPAIESALGPPVYRDDQLAVFDLKRRGLPKSPR
jgi:hypothetical protein